MRIMAQTNWIGRGKMRLRDCLSAMMLMAMTLMTAFCLLAAEPSAPENPKIDIESHLVLTRQAAELRETRRLTEAQFIAMSQEPGTIVLDARSKERFDELHLKGAINLSFPDITIASLQRTIPDKHTKILIYCNNNFEGAEQPFPSKQAAASLNLSTYAALYIYGYREIYELGPLLEAKNTKLAFEGTLAAEYR